jgi:hypothetical protein
MAKRVADALEALRNLGTPDEMRSLAERSYGPKSRPGVNTHVHLPPNFSAFESVEQAVTLAAEQEVGALGGSNYYDYQVYGDFAQLARAKGVFPLFGLEIISVQDDLRQAGVRVNDPDNPGRTYICGKGITRFDPMTDEANRLIGIIRRNDSERMATMVDRVRETFRERGLDTQLDYEAVIDTVVRRHGVLRETVYLQERHISKAFQESLFNEVPAASRIERLSAILGAKTKASGPEDYVAIQNDIRSHLMKAGKPAFVKEAFLSFEEAHRLILELGGIPSYPPLADSASPVCEYEQDPDDLVRKLKDRNIHAVEWIPVRNKTEVLRHYVTRMRGAGLVATGGTEHNTLDVIRIDPTCKDGEMPDDLRAIFWEGACVVAAHQFLTLHGECGYVDGRGRPNADYASADERIKALAGIGAAVMQRYFEMCAAR